MISAAPSDEGLRQRRGCRLSPNTSLLPGRSVVCTPTGIGKVRGSITVSEMALGDEEPVVALQAEEARRRAARRCRPRAGAPAPRRSAGRSAGRPSGVLVVGIEPALARRCRASRSAASGPGSAIWSVGKGLGRRRADRAGIVLVDRIRQLAADVGPAAALELILLGWAASAARAARSARQRPVGGGCPPKAGASAGRRVLQSDGEGGRWLASGSSRLPDP